MIVDILNRFDIENIDFVNYDNQHVLTLAFIYAVNLKTFKILYEASKLNFNEIFKNFTKTSSYYLIQNQIKILEFILMKGHKIPK